MDFAPAQAEYSLLLSLSMRPFSSGIKEEHLKGGAKCMKFGELLRSNTEQFDCYEKAFNSPPLVVEALAGTGKTTVVKIIAADYADMGKRVLYLAFNTAIVDETRSDGLLVGMTLLFIFKQIEPPRIVCVHHAPHPLTGKHRGLAGSVAGIRLLSSPL